MRLTLVLSISCLSVTVLAQGQCPPSEGKMGACVEGCDPIGNGPKCPPGKLCCGNGCGTQCMDPVPTLTSPCAATTCLVGHDCKVIHGQAVCVPLDPPVGGGRCPKVKGPGVCAELCGAGCKNGQICCSNGCGHQCMDPVPVLTNPCAATTCLVGTVCRVILGRAICVPSQPTTSNPTPVLSNPCAATTCFVGTVCRVILGRAICVPHQPPGSGGRCPKLMPGMAGLCAEMCGSGCKNGQICCSNGCGHQCMNPVPDLPHPCAAMFCGPGYTCRAVNGQGRCVRTRDPVYNGDYLCEMRQCPPNTRCLVFLGRAVCLRNYRPANES